MFFKPFGLRGHRQCPHKPPSCCNTHVIIQICVLINHIYQHTQVWKNVFYAESSGLVKSCMAVIQCVSLLLCCLKSTILISTAGLLSFFFMHGFLDHCTGIVENQCLSAGSIHYYICCLSLFTQMHWHSIAWYSKNLCCHCWSLNEDNFYESNNFTLSNTLLLSCQKRDILLIFV